MNYREKELDKNKRNTHEENFKIMNNFKKVAKLENKMISAKS